MVLLLEAVRAELGAYASKHALGYHFYPPITAPAGSSHYGKLPLANLGSKVDYTNLMTDDYAGSWSPAAGHNADVYANADRPQSTAFNTDGAVKAYLHAGVPAHKLVLGMPVYDRSFLGASDMGEPYSGVGLANKVMGSWEPGIWDYKALLKQGLTTIYDEKAQVYYGNHQSGVGIYSCDSPDPVLKKVAYLKQHGLGGVMFWETSGDGIGQDSLIRAGSTSRGESDERESVVVYPDSKYKNIALDSQA